MLGLSFTCWHVILALKATEMSSFCARSFPASANPVAVPSLLLSSSQRDNIQLSAYTPITTMSHDTSSTTNNPHIPNDYNPLPSNFQAPAHNLNKSQVESVVELAERTGHEQGSHGTSSTTTSTSHSGVGSGLTGSGSGLASGGSHGLTGSGSRVDETGGYSKTAGDHHSHGTGAGLTGAGAGVGSGLGRGASPRLHFFPSSLRNLTLILSRCNASLPINAWTLPDRDDQYETSKTQQDTSNRAPGLGTDSRVHQHQLNSIPGVGDAAPKPGKANVGGTNDGKTGPPVAQSGSDPAAEGRLGDAPGSEYVRGLPAPAAISA